MRVNINNTGIHITKIALHFFLIFKNCAFYNTLSNVVDMTKPHLCPKYFHCIKIPIKKCIFY